MAESSWTHKFTAVFRVTRTEGPPVDDDLVLEFFNEEMQFAFPRQMWVEYVVDNYIDLTGSRYEIELVGTQCTLRFTTDSIFAAGGTRKYRYVVDVPGWWPFASAYVYDSEEDALLAAKAESDAAQHRPIDPRA
jgi:hypothetical protein